MSTKIHHGKLLNIRLNQLHTWQKSLRHDLQEKANVLYSQAMAKVITDLIHYASLHTEYELARKLKKLFPDEDFDTSYTVGSVVYFGLFRKATKAMTLKVSDLDLDDWDFRAKLVVFPLQQKFLGIPIRTKLLALFHTEQSEFQSLWQGNPDVISHGYWNNTDRPDDLSVKQWTKRGNEWDQALNGFRGSTTDNGLIYSFINDPPLVKPHEALKYIKPYEERLHGVSYARVSDRLFHDLRNIKRKDPNEDADDGFYLWMKILKQVEEFLKTEEGRQLIEKEKINIANQLHVDIDADVLKVELRDFCIQKDWSNYEI